MNESVNKFSEFLEMYDQLFALLNKGEDHERVLAILRRYFRYKLNTTFDKTSNPGGVTLKGRLIENSFFLMKIRQALNSNLLPRILLDEFQLKANNILDDLSQELINITNQSNIIKINEKGLVPLKKEKRAKFEYLRNVVLYAFFILGKIETRNLNEAKFETIIFYVAAIKAIVNTEFNLLLDSNDIKPVFALAGKKSYSLRSEMLPEKSILVMTLAYEYLKYSILDSGFLPRSFNDLVFDIGADILDTYRKIMRGKNKAHCYFLESTGKIYKDFHKLIIKEVKDRLDEEKLEARKSGEDGFYWSRYKVIFANSDESMDDLFKTYHVVIKNGILHYNKIDFDSLDQKALVKNEDFIKKEKKELTLFLNNFGYKDINCRDPLKIAKFLDKNVRKLANHPYWMLPVLVHRVYRCSETYCEISRQIYSFTENLKWKLKENHEKWSSYTLESLLESNYAKLNLLLDKRNL